MLGALLAEAGVARARAKPMTQGRMTLSGIVLYKEPAFKATKLHAFGRDEVVSITGEVTGEAGNPFNSTWYQVNGEGYTYSGWVQPVESRYQTPSFEVPTGGQRLGEITVPFSITRLQPSAWAKNGFRAYYGTTYWVRGVSANFHEKSIWYEIYDDYLKVSLFVDSADMRLVPYDELAPLSPEVPDAAQVHSRGHGDADGDRIRRSASRSDGALLLGRQEHQDATGRVPDLSQGRLHPHDQRRRVGRRPGLRPAGRAVGELLHQHGRVVPRHVLAQRLRHAAQPRVREPAA